MRQASRQAQEDKSSAGRDPNFSLENLGFSEAEFRGRAIGEGAGQRLISALAGRW